jgi:hypothetical protein
MTKTNLVGAIAAVAIMTTALLFPTSAYAKSASEIAKTSTVVSPVKVTSIVAVDNLIKSRGQSAKVAIVPNRWKDSGYINVWHGKPRWIRDLGLCIRKHESMMAGHYHANNNSSSASGAYQMLSATWNGNAKWTKVNGKFVARKYLNGVASSAPDWVQDAVFIHAIEQGGIHAWYGTWCRGT